MAAYIADSDTWSTCNGGSRPADGDEITVDEVDFGVLYMDENSAPAESFTVHVPAYCELSLDGYTLEAIITIGGTWSKLSLFNGLLYMGTVSVTADGASIDLLSTGAIDGGVNAGGFTCDWSGIGTLDCTTIAGTLDLGGAATGLAITTSAATTLASALVAKSLSVGADWADAGNSITVEDLTYTAGTPTMTGDYTVRDTIAWHNLTKPLSHLISVDGYKLAAGGTISFRKFTAGTGDDGDALNALGYNIYFDPTASNAWLQPESSGKVTGGHGRFFIRPTTSVTIGRMDIERTGSLGDINFMPANAKTITQIGDWTFDTLADNTLMRTSNLHTMTVTLGNYTTRFGGIVELGYTGRTSVTTLNLAGIVTFEGGFRNAPGALGKHVVNFGSAYVESPAVFDGAGEAGVGADEPMTFTDTSGTCHIMGLGTGTLQNVVTDNLILAHDFATYGSDGTANTNVGQDTHAAPGSMALCGVGY